MTPAIFGLSGPTLTADERAFFRDCNPAGYIIFGRNVENRTQLRTLTDDLRALHGRDRLLVCVDQEGGRVARLKPPVWPAYPAGAAFARLYDLAPASAIAAMRANAHALGLDLVEAGITVDCWPCLDLPVPGADNVIGDRALAWEPMAVAALGRAVVEGLAAAGVAGVIKHLPGHGRAGADSHKTLPIVDGTEAELARDLEPFRTLAAIAPMAMTAHVRYPVWDAEAPATLSPAIINAIIRGRIGFDGLLMSDDLDMAALSGPVPQRAARAIAAGCDVVLNCWARMDEMVAIAKTLPGLTAAGNARLERALASTRIGPGVPARHAELIATRDTLLALVPA